MKRWSLTNHTLQFAIYCRLLQTIHTLHTLFSRSLQDATNSRSTSTSNLWVDKMHYSFILGSSKFLYEGVWCLLQLWHMPQTTAIYSMNHQPIFTLTNYNNSTTSTGKELRVPSRVQTYKWWIQKSVTYRSFSMIPIGESVCVFSHNRVLTLDGTYW